MSISDFQNLCLKKECLKFEQDIIFETAIAKLKKICKLEYRQQKLHACKIEILRQRLKSLNKLNIAEQKEKNKQKAYKAAERQELYIINNKGPGLIENNYSGSLDSFLAGLSNKKF